MLQDTDAFRSWPASVLVVANDLMQAVLLRKSLTNAGFTVNVAVSEEEAMKALETTLPSMILADWDVNGFDCLRMVRRIKRSSNLLYSIPVGLMTDQPQNEITNLNTKAEGVSWIIRKPISLNGVPLLIARTLDEYRKARLTETTFRRKRRLAFA